VLICDEWMFRDDGAQGFDGQVTEAKGQFGISISISRNVIRRCRALSFGVFSCSFRLWSCDRRFCGRRGRRVATALGGMMCSLHFRLSLEFHCLDSMICTKCIRYIQSLKMDTNLDMSGTQSPEGIVRSSS
jgi:hypothetical protein